MHASTLLSAFQCLPNAWQVKEVGALDSYARGLSICAGKIAIETDHDTDAYSRLVSEFLANDPGSYNLLDHRITNADGSIEQRIVMSVAPGIKGATLPPGQMP